MHLAAKKRRMIKERAGIRTTKERARIRIP